VISPEMLNIEIADIDRGEGLDLGAHGGTPR
jgi:hypothetical protein